MSRVGVVGGGQLARMLALAGKLRQIDFLCLESAGEPVSGLVTQIQAPYDDAEGLRRLAECDVVTWEFENVPESALQFLDQFPHVRPRPRAVRVSQDRLLEKQLFSELGMGTAPYAPVDSEEQLQAAVQRLGAPGILKTRRLGYDGKGQQTVEPDRPLPPVAPGNLYEVRVPFERELSLIAVRSLSGEVGLYPLVENEHRGGILHRSRWVRTERELWNQAQEMGLKLLEALDYVGVLVLEMFQVQNQLLCNEFAPRVHNSGHWTIEGAVTSQFDNHLRAILGQPLGPCEPLCPSAMLNCIGQLPDERRVLAVPGAHLHLYGKAPRPGRKLGHITVLASDEGSLAEQVRELEEWL